MKKIQIFDVDGTLTFHEKDRKEFLQNTFLPTFSYWALITFNFCTNKKHLKDKINAWETSMIDESDPDLSSLKCLQEIIYHDLQEDLNKNQVKQYAKEITQELIKIGGIRYLAINYINTCLSNNVICVLTTGSYLDGLYGFIESLQQNNLLITSNNLVLHGAEINWNEKKVIHANVGQYKVKNLTHYLNQLTTSYEIQAVFGDDPNINDKGLFDLITHNQSFVIRSHKNLINNESFPYIHCDWQEFITKHKDRVLEK